MGKITISLPDEVEKALREFVTKTYPEKPFGKLSSVMTKAVKQYLKLD